VTPKLQSRYKPRFSTSLKLYFDFSQSLLRKARQPLLIKSTGSFIGQKVMGSASNVTIEWTFI
jgi:hypothetical protein